MKFRSFRVLQYCYRGSLYHLLNSNYYSNLELNLEIKICLIRDIINGMIKIEVNFEKLFCPVTRKLRLVTYEP